jgi:hypothetical protein
VSYDLFYSILISAFCWLKYGYSPDDQITGDGWAGHAVHMGEKINAYRGMVKKAEGKRSLSRPMCRMEDTTEINPTERGWDRIHLAQDMHKWWALANTGMHIYVP